MALTLIVYEICVNIYTIGCIVSELLVACLKSAVFSAQILPTVCTWWFKNIVQEVRLAEWSKAPDSRALPYLSNLI